MDAQTDTVQPLSAAPRGLRAQQLIDQWGQRMASGLWAPGTRLPSVRRAAQQYGVSPSTVVAAYDALQARGWVQARAQSGFYVRAPSTLPSSASAPQAARALVAPLNAGALIRGMFQAPAAVPQPGMGAFPPDWLDAPFVRTALRAVLRGPQAARLATSYGEPAGEADLRAALAQRLQALAIPAEAAQILTTQGATQALDIVSRSLLRAGDAVMVEEPGWAVEFARLQAQGLRILPVPRGPQGPDLTVMAHWCSTAAPRLFVSVSVLHNPTGYTLAPGHAHRVLQLAQAHGFYIAEDDTYAHLAAEGATRLAALDGLQRTIYVGGFSKVLAPGWRVGYLAAPAALFDKLLETRLLSSLTTPALPERALAHCIAQGQLRRHVQQLLRRLDAARQRTVRLALAHGFSLAAPAAGLFGWIEAGVDTDVLALQLLDAGYLIAPGSLFTASRQPGRCLRINYCTSQKAEFWATAARLRDGLARGG